MYQVVQEIHTDNKSEDFRCLLIIIVVQQQLHHFITTCQSFCEAIGLYGHIYSYSLLFTLGYPNTYFLYTSIYSCIVNMHAMHVRGPVYH